MNIVIIFYYVIFTAMFGDCGRRQTRILLNDYDTIQAVQNLVKKYNDLESTLKQSNTRIVASHDQVIEYTTIQSLVKWNEDFVKKYNTLEHNYTVLTTTNKVIKRAQSNFSIDAKLQTLLQKNQELDRKYNTLTSMYNRLEAYLNTTVANGMNQNQALLMKYKNIENKYIALDAKNKGGAIFVHWGKPTCPGKDTILVYAGYLGGSEHNTKGAATTHLCLSPDPQWGTMPSISPNFINVMYGSELDWDYAGPNSGPQDNTCAVCKSQIHSTALMIPGRHECYPGWKKQYSGNLMTSPVGYSQKEIICLNDHPEFTVGGGARGYGNLLYPIKAVCGSLECPPYVNQKLITCVVCTQ